MFKSRCRLLVVFANLLLPSAIFLFASGFFPYKPYIPGVARYEDIGLGDPPNGHFDRVVFMVIDALRSDFIFGNGSGFTFTQGSVKVLLVLLIKKGIAVPFTAHATPPTITMPRIKAITTGSVPSFLDVILNFAESDTTSTLISQDTWLLQMKAKNTGNLIMFGDDTWLKLFPGMFERADGTTSFFVSDFTEVDQNVTRHLPRELETEDWNTMILHFLGLDHIGHNQNMFPKQREMDNIVEQIYTAIETQSHLRDTLLVVCGDHGMNDAGNHGGSGAGETSAGLVFLSPKFKALPYSVSFPEQPRHNYRYHSFVEQSDIAPTLAALLGFPIPQNNLGIILRDFLRLWATDDQVNILFRNAQQIMNIANATFGGISNQGRSILSDCVNVTGEEQELSCLWQNALISISQFSENRNTEARETSATIDVLFRFLQRSQEVLSSTATNYDIQKLIGGVVICTAATLAAVTYLFLSSVVSLASGLFFATLVVFYSIMMFASSYVEEEHHFWYWSLSAWTVIIHLKHAQFTKRNSWNLAIQFLVCLSLLRIVRRWNQTGQKHAGEPDISRHFFPKHNYLLWGLIIATYLNLAFRLANRSFRQLYRQLSQIIAITLCLSSFAFKVSFTGSDAPELLEGFPISILVKLADLSLVTQARSVFMGLVIALVYLGYCIVFNASQRATSTEKGDEVRLRAWHQIAISPGYIPYMSRFHDLLALFLVTQSRATNIPLFLIFDILLQMLGNLNLSPSEISMTSLLMQYMAFFAFGGSNAISSIDLSNAYNGISGYHVSAVALLTYVSNWAGPIWWASATSLMCLESRASARSSSEFLFTHISILTVFVTSSLAATMAACTALRTHLFIWTVFSPKYLFSMAWSIAHHICINLIGFSLLHGTSIRQNL